MIRYFASAPEWPFIIPIRQLIVVKLLFGCPFSVTGVTPLTTEIVLSILPLNTAFSGSPSGLLNLRDNSYHRLHLVFVGVSPTVKARL